MALYPKANYRPVCNYSGPRSPKWGFVLHVTQGYGSPWEEFNTPSFEASAHFWVSRAGVVEQYIDTAYASWAQVDGNAGYVSCETEGFGVAAVGEPATALTDAQLQAVAELLAWSHQVDGWDLQLVDHGGDGFTSHCHYPSGLPDPAWGDHTCPGPIRMGQMPRLLAMVESLLDVHPYPVGLGGGVPAWPGVYLQLTSPYMTWDGTGTVQLHLTDVGFPVVFDHIYGPQTAAAVRAFQAHSGLTVDGIVGPITWGELVA